MSRIPRMGKFGLFDRGRGPAVFVILVLFVAAGTVAWLSRGAAERKPLEVVSNVVPDLTIDGVNIDDRFDAFDPKTQEWGAIEDGTPEGHRRIPTRALAKAAEITATKSWALMKLTASTLDSERLGFPHAEIESLFGSPSRWRGLPVSILGRLDELSDVDLFDRYDFRLPDGRFKVREGMISSRADIHGSAVPVKFTLIDEPLDENLPAIGSAVKLQGVFFKIQMLDLPDGGSERGLWILGKRLYPSFRLPEPRTANLSTLAEVNELTMAEQYDPNKNIFDEEPLRELIGAVADGQAFANPEVKELRGKQLRDLLAKPNDYRGGVIEVQARVLRVVHHSMAAFYPQHDANDNRVHEFWHTYVTTDGALPITVMWLDEPPRDLASSDLVNIRGVFYKNWSYRAGSEKSGKVRIVRSPLLIGLGSLEVKVLEPYSGFDPVVWGILVFSVLAVLVVVFVVRADRKKSRLFQAERRAKQQLERGRLDLNSLADADPSSSQD